MPCRFMRGGIVFTFFNMDFLILPKYTRHDAVMFMKYNRYITKRRSRCMKLDRLLGILTIQLPCLP